MLTKSVPASPPDRISLKQRVLSAGAWSLAGYGFSQALRFGGHLIMTRLLVPEMFGVMAIATMVMVGLSLFSDLGLKQSIVQSRRGADPEFLNTAWAMQILRGLLLWLIALAVALGIYLAGHAEIVHRSTVYADPSLPWVVAILSFSLVISGFGSTKLFETSRSLALRRVTLIELAAQVCGLTCMLIWASIDRSIWALVAGAICSALSTTVLSHVWLPGIPNRWRWDPSAFQEIFHFGKWIFLASILGFLVNNGDRLLLGSMVEATVLGIYVIAFFIVNSAEQVLLRIISSVTYPALSEIARERRSDLKENYYRIHAVLASFAYFCSGVLMSAGQSLVGLFYDPRYAEAGWMVEILAATLLTGPIQISMQCFMALGKPRLYSNIIAVRLVFLFVAMPVGFAAFGLRGGLWGIVLSYYSYLPIIIFYTMKNELFDMRKELLPLSATVLGLGTGKLFAVLVGSQ